MITTPTISPPLSLSTPSPLHQQPTFLTHGWTIQIGHQTTKTIAIGWYELAISAKLKQWEQKRGGFYQHDANIAIK